MSFPRSADPWGVPLANHRVAPGGVDRAGPWPGAPAPPTPSIVGNVERVTGRAVTGWIANLHRPERLEPVVVQAPNGDQLSFRPYLPRLDVCAAIDRSGRFGFSIPTAALRALGPVVRFGSREGAALGGGDAVALPPPARDASIDRQTWVALHIPKTAGTSLRVALAGSVGSGEVALVYPDGQSGLLPTELPTLNQTQLAALRLVIGHVPFGFGECLPNAAGYVTFLRSPADRLRSNYFHHADRGTGFTVGGRPVPLAQVVSGALTEEFDNLMVRQILGCGASLPVGQVALHHVAAALANIRDRFRFVGLVERLPEHYPALCHALGIAAAALPRDNRRLGGAGAADGSAVDWAQVMHANRFDALLYEQAVAQNLTGRALSPAAAQGERGAGQRLPS